VSAAIWLQMVAGDFTTSPCVALWAVLGSNQ
jgi:hypothetical protein